MEQAQAMFARGDHEAGYVLLETTIEQAPGNLELGNFYRARIVEHGQEDRAISFFKKLTERGELPDEAYYNFAFAYIDKIPRVGPMGAGFLSKRSIAQFKIVQERRPEDWIANYGIGMNYLHWPDYFKKTEGALGYFEKCMEIQQSLPLRPQYLLTYLRMGDALVRGGQKDEAYRVWRQGLEKFPGHADLLDRVNTPPERIETAIRELYNPNNSIGAIDTDISILWASTVPASAVPLKRNTLRQAGVGGQLRGADAQLDRSQINLFAWFTRNLPYLSDRGSITKADMSLLGVERGTGLEGRINAIAFGMINGFMAQLEGETVEQLQARARAVDSFTRPFFHEGLGMGYAAAVSLDDIDELKRMEPAMREIDANFERLHLAGAGMWFGLEGARSTEQIAAALRQLGPFGEAYAYEGYGFARTLFYYKTNPEVVQAGTALRAEAAANFYHGSGRAFWILSGADPSQGEQYLQSVPEAYRDHAYSGFAMGMAFTQVDDLPAVMARVAAVTDKERHRHQLAGVAMGLYIRRLGDSEYVETLLAKVGSPDRCIARNLLTIGEAALQASRSGAGDLHSNWRAEIERQIEAQPPKAGAECARTT
jgi:tetratricopeptide (TPR) repeat protein